MLRYLPWEISLAWEIFLASSTWRPELAHSESRPESHIEDRFPKLKTEFYHERNRPFHETVFPCPLPGIIVRYHCHGFFSFILSSSCFSCHCLISLITSGFSYHILYRNFTNSTKTKLIDRKSVLQNGLLRLPWNRKPFHKTDFKVKVQDTIPPPRRHVVFIASAFRASLFSKF